MLKTGIDQEKFTREMMSRFFAENGTFLMTHSMQEVSPLEELKSRFLSFLNRESTLDRPLTTFMFGNFLHKIEQSLKDARRYPNLMSDIFTIDQEIVKIRCDNLGIMWSIEEAFIHKWLEAHGGYEDEESFEQARKDYKDKCIAKKLLQENNSVMRGVERVRFSCNLG